jgi:hypothetical protein
VRGGDLETHPAVAPGLVHLGDEPGLVDLAQLLPGVDAGRGERGVEHHGRVLPPQGGAEEGDRPHPSLLDLVVSNVFEKRACGPLMPFSQQVPAPWAARSALLKHILSDR